MEPKAQVLVWTFFVIIRPLSVLFVFSMFFFPSNSWLPWSCGFKSQKAPRGLEGFNKKSRSRTVALEAWSWRREICASHKICITFDHMNALFVVKRWTKGTIVHTDKLSVKSYTAQKNPKNLKTPEVASENQHRCSRDPSSRKPTAKLHWALL